MPEIRFSAGLGEGVLVASGASFVVVRGRVDGDHAERIWDSLRDERPLAEVLDAVTRGRLGDLPDFVVVVPHPSGGSRMVQRPGLEVVAVGATGERETLSALDSALWSERTVPADRVVEIDLTGAGGDAGTLPLGAGVVPATFVRWSPDTILTAAAAPASNSARADQGDLEEAPMPAIAPLGVEVATPADAEQPIEAVAPADVEPPFGLEGVEDAHGAHEDPAGVEPESAVDRASDEAVATSTGLTVSGFHTITEDQLVADRSEGDVAPAVAEEPVPEIDPYDSLFGATTHRSVESAAVRAGAEPSRPDPLREDEEAARADLDAAFVIEQVPVVAPDAADDGGTMIDSVPVAGAVPGQGANAQPGDHDGYTISAASLRQLRGGESPDLAPAGPARTVTTPVVHAITCASGHPNPPQSGTCRVCGSPLAFQEPITVPRPPLGVLVFAGGHEVTLDRFVLIGRSPAVERVAPGDLPHLVKLDSPSKDLSRNHVEVRLEGWHVLVVDLQSTNGTVVQLPGRAPERVHPLEPYAIVPGTVVTIGDEQSFVYEVRG